MTTGFEIRTLSSVSMRRTFSSEVGELNRTCFSLPMDLAANRASHNRSVGLWNHRESMGMHEQMASGIPDEASERYASAGLSSQMLEWHTARKLHNLGMGLELLEEEEFNMSFDREYETESEADSLESSSSDWELEFDALDKTDFE
eukprot:3556793-Rhodomonas_salina.1